MTRPEKLLDVPCPANDHKRTESNCRDSDDEDRCNYVVRTPIGRRIGA
jgi:hypothetical protein